MYVRIVPSELVDAVNIGMRVCVMRYYHLIFVSVSEDFKLFPSW